MSVNQRHAAALTIAELQDELSSRQVKVHFATFVKFAWPILEPGTALLWNWHLDLLCEYLQAVSEGRLRHLVINAPPRSGKSVITSVMWPAYEWLTKPQLRYLCVSHSDRLAEKLNSDRRNLILSPLYQRWSPDVRLTAHQRAKTTFSNTRRGAMMSMSMGSSLTGIGGDRLIIDDPQSADSAERDSQRQLANDRLRHTLLTRLDDKARGAIVVVMQRLHTDDLSDFCLQNDFTPLCLPALAPTKTTIHFPLSRRTKIRERDEPLWPERESTEVLAEQRRLIGSYNFAAQFQQDPILRTGGFFPAEWWTYYHELPSGPAQWMQSWDLALKESDDTDYVVGLVATRVGARIFLVDRFKARANFGDTCSAIRAMHERYPQTEITLIEDAANGPAVVDYLRREIPRIVAVTPEGGKLSRAHVAHVALEARQILLPNPYAADGALRRDRAWVEDFVTSCEAFPKGRHDDDVDALSQLIVRLQNNPVVALASAWKEPEPVFLPRMSQRPEYWINVSQGRSGAPRLWDVRRPRLW